MQIFRAIADIRSVGASVVTVGTFDGVHLGHQAIIQQVKDFAANHSRQSAIVTFDPHPRKVLGKGPVTILTTTAEKLDIFADAGIDQVVVIPFSREFAALSSEAFVTSVLVDKLTVREMVVGYDHHFGRNREGGFEALLQLGRRHGFTVHQVPQLVNGGEAVSSTYIRQLLETGDVAKAARFMGRRYCIEGIVKPGDGRGKQIGFPTANLELSEADKQVPGRGVYAVDVEVDQQSYGGMMNIGIRPTFDFDYLTLEAHLFNFNDSLYEKKLKVRFKKFLRPEKKFSGIEELRAQLKKDKQMCEFI